MKRIWLIFGMIFLVSGCVLQEPALVKSTQQQLLLSDLDEGCKKALPITKVGDFGTVKVLTVLIQGGDKSDTLSVTVRFMMTSFEIPEGIEGIVRYTGTLRYDPVKKALYFANLQTTSLTFGGDAALHEYITTAARQGVPVLVAQALESVPLYQLKEGFAAKALQSFKVYKENIVLSFR